MADESIAKEFTDERVRKMFERSGFDVTVSDDVSNFARFIRALFAEFEARQRRREARRAWYIASMGAAVPVIATVVLKLLKVM